MLVFMWKEPAVKSWSPSFLAERTKDRDSKAILALHHPKSPGRLQAQPSSTFSEVVAAWSSSEVLQEKSGSALPLETRSGAQDNQNYLLTSPCWANFHQDFSLNLSSHPIPVTGTPTAPSTLLLPSPNTTGRIICPALPHPAPQQPNPI